MPKISTSLSISGMIIAIIIGYMIGFSNTPEYSLNMYDKGAMDLGRADRGLDLRYIDAMIVHHRGAVILAERAQGKSQRQEINDLSLDILKNEPAAIQELYDWKKAWYGDSRKVRDPLVPNLGTYDDKFDLRFLNALIAHHADWLVMANEAKTKSSRLEILNNADAVGTFFTTTMQTFKDWRKEWYQI